VNSIIGCFSGKITSSEELKKDGWSPEEGWFLVTSYDMVEAAVRAYHLCFNIEEMFLNSKG
jgi:hypothetical protein